MWKTEKPAQDKLKIQGETKSTERRTKNQRRPKTYKGKLNVFKEKLATCQERPKCPQIIF
jgi:hypothetical protein